MFDIAWSEFLIVAVVALVVVGPKDLPGLLRTVGKTVASLRRMAGDFQSQFNEAMREAELDDLKREVTGLKDAATKLTGSASPFEIARDELKSAIEGKPKPPSALAGASETAPAAADAPSALAPQLAPLDEPPAPSAADFAYPASKAEPVSSIAAKTDAAEPAKPAEAPKPAAKSKSAKATASAVKATPKKAIAKKPKDATPPAAETAPAAPKRKAVKKVKPTEPTTPGAAS